MSLQTIIQQIKSATLPGENTAIRVGSAFEQMDTAKRDKSDSLSKSETVDMINAVKIIAATGTPFLGTIDPATVIPAGDFWAFAGEGTYTNADGIIIGAGEIAIITRVGTTFDSVVLDVPVKSIEGIEKTSTVGLVDTYTITYTDGSTPTTFEVTNGNNAKIPIWSAQDYLSNDQVIKDNVIFITPNGALSTEVPGVSDKWITMGGDDAEVRSVLKWFLDQRTTDDEPLKVYAITEAPTTPVLFGVNVETNVMLQKTNTLITPPSAAGVRYDVFRNLPIKEMGIAKIKLKLVPYLNNDPNHCSLLAIDENGTITHLVTSEIPNSIHDYEFNVSQYKFLSLGWVNANSVPSTSLQKIEFYLSSGEIVVDIVKDYIDKKYDDIVIYTNRTLYPLKYGFKESNTEAQNKEILDGLINIAFNEARSIELPEGKYPISNVTMKPCHLYGKDRNTMLESNTAEPMFTLDPAYGIQNINNHTTAGFAGGYYTGFEVAGFVLKGNDIATKGFYFGTHAFAHYDRLVFHGFADVAIHTTGMLICTFGDIEIRKVQNGIRAEMLGAYAANLVCFDFLNIEGCRGIGVDWKNGSGIHFKRLDAEKCGTTGNVNTGVIQFSDIYSDYVGMMGVTIDKSWSEDINGGFFAKLNGNAVHAIRDTNILKLSSDAQNYIINNGGKLFLENNMVKGNFGVSTINGGQTMLSGFSSIPSHTESSGGVYRDLTTVSPELFLTQSQYDALSNDQKNNGTKYFIS